MNFSSQSSPRIRSLLLTLKQGEVVTSSKLRNLGISERVTSYLKQQKVLTPLGIGAYVKGVETPNFASAIQALTEQQGLPLHLGGKTALSLHGLAQYLTLGAGSPAWLFASRKLKLPLWFVNTKWNSKPYLVQSQLISPDLNDTILQLEIDGFSVMVSCRERAILETIHQIGKKHRFEEVDELFESLMTVNPKIIQRLLEDCNSIRVCRIFLFLTRKHKHPWADKLDESKVTLGNGKRIVVKGGKLDSRYQITVPREEIEPDV